MQDPAIADETAEMRRLRLEEGLTYQAIANLYGLSESSVYIRLGMMKTIRELPEAARHRIWWENEQNRAQR